MRILTAVDRSEYSEIVLEHGLDQAVRNPDAELHFATVVEAEADRDAARAWLDAMVRDGLDTFGLAGRNYVVHVRSGRPVPAIGVLAAELSVDLLVLGRFHVPSVSEGVVEIVECPTLVVGADGPVLEPQCPDCRAARRDSEGERLFCAGHANGRLPELAMRLPPSTNVASRIW